MVDEPTTTHIHSVFISIIFLLMFKNEIGFDESAWETTMSSHSSTEKPNMFSYKKEQEQNSFMDKSSSEKQKRVM